MFAQMTPSQERNFGIIEKKFPRIANTIRLSWGTAVGKEYLEGLIIDDRGGRAGFPIEVMAALMELESDYKVFAGTRSFSPGKDVWEDSADPAGRHNKD